MLVKAYNKNIKEVIKKSFFPANHAVVLVKKDNKSIIIDPTNATIGILNKNKKCTKKIMNMSGDDSDTKYKFSFSLDDSILSDIKDDYLIQTSDILEPNNYLENLKIEDNGDFKEKNKELIKSIFELCSK